jgi:prepilin peptidase CpaA
MAASIWLLLGACLIAAYTDLRTRRISNWLTGSLAFAAVVVHGLSGLNSALVTLAILIAGLFIGALVYSSGAIGGGDVKLAIAASAMAGFPLCIAFLLYSAIGGGLLAIAFIIARGGFKHSLVRLAASTAGGAARLPADKTQALPYAVAFAFGAFAIALSQSVAPFLRISL